MDKNQDVWLWSLAPSQICFLTLIYTWKGVFCQLQSARGKVALVGEWRNGGIIWQQKRLLPWPSPLQHHSCHWKYLCDTWMQCRGSNAGVTRILQLRRKIEWYNRDLCTHWIIFLYFTKEKNPFLERISLVFYNLSSAISLNNVIWPPLQVSQMVNGVHGKSSD